MMTLSAAEGLRRLVSIRPDLLIDFIVLYALAWPTPDHTCPSKVNLGGMHERDIASTRMLVRLLGQLNRQFQQSEVPIRSRVM
jgi:hypothetical protein